MTRIVEELLQKICITPFLISIVFFKGQPLYAYEIVHFNFILCLKYA